MLTSLLDLASHALYSYRLACCSMKSIGQVSLCNKTALYLVPRVSHGGCQAARQAVSGLLTERLENGSCASFLYESTQGRNIPLKPTRIQIWAKNSPNQKNWLILLPSQQNYHICVSLLCSSLIHNCFLHACTPERRTRALAPLFTQREHGHTPDTTKHILQKTFKVLKR